MQDLQARHVPQQGRKESMWWLSPVTSWDTETLPQLLANRWAGCALGSGESKLVPCPWVQEGLWACSQGGSDVLPHPHSLPSTWISPMLLSTVSKVEQDLGNIINMELEAHIKVKVKLENGSGAIWDSHSTAEDHSVHRVCGRQSSSLN